MYHKSGIQWIHLPRTSVDERTTTLTVTSSRLIETL